MRLERPIPIRTIKAILKNKEILEVAKNDRNCVIEAIGSAVGATPSDVARTARITDIGQLKSDKDFSAEFPKETDRQTALDIQYAKDTVKVGRLIGRLAKGDDSPFGDRLREHTFKRKVLTPPKIRERITKGHQVCIAESIMYDSGDVDFHMEHIGITTTGEFFSKTDREAGSEIIIDLLEGEKFNTYVFSPKIKLKE